MACIDLYLSLQELQPSASDRLKVSSDLPNRASAFVCRQRLVLATLVKPLQHDIAVDDCPPTNAITLHCSMRTWVQTTGMLQIRSEDVLQRR